MESADQTEPMDERPRGLHWAAEWSLVLVVLAALLALASRESGLWTGAEDSFIICAGPEGTPVYRDIASPAEPVGVFPEVGCAVAESDHRDPRWLFLTPITEGPLRTRDEQGLAGFYVRRENVVAPSIAELRRLGVRPEDTGGITLDELGRKYTARFSQDTSDEWTVLRTDYWRGGSSVWVYRRRGDGRPETEFALTAEAYTCALMVPGLEVLPSDGRGAPRVASFSPPVGLRVWTWDGAAYSPAFPAWRDLPGLGELVRRGLSFWLVAIVGFVAMWAVGFREVLRPAPAALAFAVWAVSAVLMWPFPFVSLAGLGLLAAHPDVGCMRKLVTALLMLLTSAVLLALAIGITD